MRCICTVSCLMYLCISYESESMSETHSVKVAIFFSFVFENIHSITEPTFLIFVVLHFNR